MLNELVQIAQSLPQAQGQLARAHYRLAIINKERADDAAYEHHKELALQIRAALRPEDKQADPAFEEALFQELCLWLLW